MKHAQSAIKCSVGQTRFLKSRNPGHLGCLDSCYIGDIPAIGNASLQIYMDCYSNVSMAKVYHHDNSATAADLLRSRVLPWYMERGIRLQRVLTDRRMQYCDSPGRNVFVVFLKTNAIAHLTSTSASPDEKSICERIFQMRRPQFRARALEGKAYRNLHELQTKADMWFSTDRKA